MQKRRPSAVSAMLSRYIPPAAASTTAHVLTDSAGSSPPSKDSSVAQADEALAVLSARRALRPSAVPAMFSRLQQDLQELLSARRSSRADGSAVAKTSQAVISAKLAVDATRTRLACDMSRVRSLDFTVLSKGAQPTVAGSTAGARVPSCSTENVCGRVVVPLSSLWGDEDSVLSQYELCIDRWFRLTTDEESTEHGSVSASPRTPGHLRLHIRMKCYEQLMPPGWVEAFDCSSRTSYYFNTLTSTSQWTEPTAIYASRTGKPPASAGSPSAPNNVPDSISALYETCSDSACADLEAGAGSHTASTSPPVSRASRIAMMKVVASPTDKSTHPLSPQSAETVQSAVVASQLPGDSQSVEHNSVPPVNAGGCSEQTSVQDDVGSRASHASAIMRDDAGTATGSTATHPLDAVKPTADQAPGTIVAVVEEAAVESTVFSSSHIALGDHDALPTSQSFVHLPTSISVENLGLAVDSKAADAAELDSSDDEAPPPPELPGEMSQDASLGSSRGPEVPDFENPLAGMSTSPMRSAG